MPIDTIAAQIDAEIATRKSHRFGIKLGPGETIARMRIADVASVHALLQGLAQISARPQATEAMAEDAPLLADTTAH